MFPSLSSCVWALSLILQVASVLFPSLSPVSCLTIAAPGDKWVSQVGINKEETPHSALLQMFIVSQKHDLRIRHPVCLFFSEGKVFLQLLCQMTGSL